MKYMSHAGDYEIEDRRGLLVRAAKLGRNLWLPATGALIAAVFGTVARLAGPLTVRAGIDRGIAEGDKIAV